MSEAQVDEINVLKLSLHERLIGYLAGYQGGRNVLSFVDEFKSDAGRPTFSLITHLGACPRIDQPAATKADWPYFQLIFDK